jgi:hypothetical protein
VARIWGGLVLLVALLVLGGYVWSWVKTGEGDPYAAEDFPPVENLPPLLMFVAALGLGIGWRREGLGGTIAVAAQLAALPVLLLHWPMTEDFPRYLVAPYGVWAVIAIPGVLFLVSWRRSREVRGAGVGARLGEGIDGAGG